MADLVYRLRNPIGTSGSDFNSVYWCGITKEAADRIEVLEREKASWKGAYDGAVLALTERNKELETALRKIAAMTPDPEFGTLPIEAAIKVARAALGEKKDAD